MKKSLKIWSGTAVIILALVGIAIFTPKTEVQIDNGDLKVGGGGTLTVGATISTGTVDGSTSLTISHTVDTGSNLLVVSIAVGDTSGTSFTPTPSSVTFGGTNMSLAIDVATDGTNDGASIWYLTSPAVTTANIIITVVSNKGIAAAAYNFSNASVANPIGNTAVNDNCATTSCTVTVASTDAAHYVVDAMLAFDPADTMVIGANQTSIATNLYSGATHDTHGNISYEIGTGDRVMSWSWTNNGGFAGTVAAEIKECDGTDTDCGIVTRPRRLIF